MPTKRTDVTGERAKLASKGDVAKQLDESNALSPTDELLLKEIDRRITQDWLQLNYMAWRFELGARHRSLVRFTEPKSARDEGLLQVAVLADVPAKWQEEEERRRGIARLQWDQKHNEWQEEEERRWEIAS